MDEGLQVGMSIELPLAAIIAALVLNAFVALLYRHDKRMAMKAGRRTPESKLLLAALIAPFGAALAMSHYRHKTRKLKFLLVYAFMLLQLLAVVYLAWMTV